MAGRPSPIDHVIGHRANGDPITVADRIVDSLRVGSYFEQACAAAGINKDTGYTWLRTAGRHRLATRNLPPDKTKPTAHERRCLAFSDAVAEAESSWEVNALAALEFAARGGSKVPTVTEKQDAQGNVTERTVRTETLAPNVQVIEWRLERRFPSRYGRRVEVAGADGGPVVLSFEDRREALAETLAAYLDGEASKPKAKRKRAPRPNGANGAGVSGPA